MAQGDAGSASGGSSSDSNDDDFDWGIHDGEDENCSWVHNLGYFAQQRTFWDLMSDLSLFPTKTA